MSDYDRLLSDDDEVIKYIMKRFGRTADQARDDMQSARDRWNEGVRFVFGGDNDE